MLISVPAVQSVDGSADIGSHTETGIPGVTVLEQKAAGGSLIVAGQLGILGERFDSGADNVEVALQNFREQCNTIVLLILCALENEHYAFTLMFKATMPHVGLVRDAGHFAETALQSPLRRLGTVVIQIPREGVALVFSVPLNDGRCSFICSGQNGCEALITILNI